MLIFYESVIHGTPLPNLTWDRTDTWSMDFAIEGEPTSITLWELETRGHRDWRFRRGMEKYQATPIAIKKGAQSYSIDIVKPRAGTFKGYFVEVEYAEVPLGKFKLSTDIVVSR